MESSNKIEAIQSLRGIASLIVAWFHLTQPAAYLPLQMSGMHGGLGVDIFFVISGFIIPYALYRSGYRLKDFPIFLVKRIVRLDPPYLCSIIIVLLVFLSTIIPPWLRGEPHQAFVIDPVRLALHFGYLNDYFDYKWMNPVFWTLAIEFQYYILIGLLFPLLASRRVPFRFLALVLLVALTFLFTTKPHIGTFIFLFLMGIATWQMKVGMISARNYWILLILFVICAFLRTHLLSALAGVFAVLAILMGEGVKVFKHPVLLFLGDISYSLYLVHFPVGQHFLNIYRSRRYDGGAPPPAEELLITTGALLFCILCSYVLYRVVEVPSRRLASSIRYRRSGEGRLSLVSPGESQAV